MSNFKAAGRVTRIKSSPSAVAAARAQELKAQGRDLIDLTVGEPDFETPRFIKDAGIEAIEAGETRYTPVNGTPRLRRAIAARMKRFTGVEFPDAQICVGGGAKQIIFLALMAGVEAGDEVIVPAPYWVSYPDMVLANDGAPVVVECPEADGFKLRPEALEAAITPRTRWLILNAPSNPTGAAYSRAELVALGEVLARHPQVWVLTDEIYDEIRFEAEPIVSLVTACPALADRVFVVNGVSKTYAMTGWRIGYGCGPSPLVAAVNKLQSQMSSCPSSISQAAAAAALDGEQGFLTGMIAAYRERRDLAVQRLNAIDGLSCLTPGGAFYLFPNCLGVIGRTTPEGATIATDLDFVLYLLDNGVAAIQGSAYGLAPHFRISIATSLENVEEACRRIEAAVRTLR